MNAVDLPAVAASVDGASPASGLEVARPGVPPTAATVGGTDRVWVRAEHVVPGDVVVPKYGQPYKVEAVFLRVHGFVQLRGAEGKTKLWVTADTPLLVKR